MMLRLRYDKHLVSVIMWNRYTNLGHKRSKWKDEYPLYKQLRV